MRKIKIPRWIIIVSSSFAALINLTLTLVVIAIFMGYWACPVTASILWFPFTLLEMYIFGLGVSLFLAELPS